MRLLSSLPCLCLIAACGGRQDVPDAKLDLEPSVHGFIVIEERLGKSVADAWFTRTSAPRIDDEFLWQSDSQYCRGREALAVDGSGKSSRTLTQAGTGWQQMLFVGDTIDVTTRTGTVISLQAQRYEDAVLYAAQERWYPAALPDDAHLSIAGSTVYPAFESVALAALEPLVRVQPENGVLAALSDPIVWQASAGSDARIELTVSALAGSGEGAEILSVRCSLEDVGRFSLPDVVQAAMPGVSQAGVTMVRKRETQHHAGNATLTITRLSYP